MSERSFEFQVELRRPGGAAVAREAVDPAFLRPAVAETIFAGQRAGIVGPAADASTCHVAPVYLEEAAPRVRALRLEVAAGGSSVVREFPLDLFLEPATALTRRLLKGGIVSAKDTVHTRVYAFPRREAGSEELRPAGFPQGTLRSAPLPLNPGKLADWVGRSRLLDPDAHDEQDVPVFIRESVLSQSRTLCRPPDNTEGGALLVGRLFQQSTPHPEIFVVIEAALQIEHAIQEQFSLTFTSETYASFQRRLALRRARLGRPTEMLVALSHGHPFGPSAASSREPSKCPSCDRRNSCHAHSSRMSDEDRTFFRSILGKQPYAVGLIWGLDSRGNDVLKVYGSRLGCFRERSIRVVEETGEEAHP